MKLYFSPGACALASQIVLRETELKFDLVKVDLKNKTTNEGDFRSVNPKGYVPALKLDNGEVLTEGTAILQYLCDQRADRKLLPANGTHERYRAIEWLNYVATELHKGIGILFSPLIKDEATRNGIVDGLHAKFEFVDQRLAKNQFVLGSSFSAVDAYLYNILRWPAYLKIDMAKYKAIGAFMERVEARPTVRASLEAEGIAK